MLEKQAPLLLKEATYTKIATTNWLKEQISTNLLKVTPDSNYYKKLEKTLTIGEINGCELVFVADDHSDSRWTRMDKLASLEGCIADDKTQGIVFEYFAPELKANARNSSIIERSLMSLEFRNSNWRKRLFSFDSLARVCKKYQKTAFTADIANSPDYMVRRNIGYRLLPVVLWPSLANNNPEFLMTAAGFAFTNLVGGLLHGIETTAQPNRFERYMVGGEDARRLFLARGLEKITESFQETNNKRLFIFYPQAHIDRVVPYLNNPETNNNKENFYRFVLHGLDFSVRKYVPDASNRELSGWRKEASIPF